MSRKVNQGIYVDGPCFIKLKELHKSHAKIGIEAATGTRIRRGEISPEPPFNESPTNESEVRKSTNLT